MGGDRSTGGGADGDGDFALYEVCHQGELRRVEELWPRSEPGLSCAVGDERAAKPLVGEVSSLSVGLSVSR